VELQVPYNICTKVQTENHLWETKGGDWENTKGTVQLETGKHNRSGDMSGSCTYASRNPTKDKRIKFCGISERQEYAADI
jgi:hypothetical protein